MFLGNITTWLGNGLNVSLLNWSIVFPMWIVPLDLYFWDGLQPPISLNQFNLKSLSGGLHFHGLLILQLWTYRSLIGSWGENVRHRKSDDLQQGCSTWFVVQWSLTVVGNWSLTLGYSILNNYVFLGISMAVLSGF